MATTFSTVVRDGPWMCKAEMQASIKRWRCRLWAVRARGEREGASAFFRRGLTSAEPPA